jgi:hypothetical protein
MSPTSEGKVGVLILKYKQGNLSLDGASHSVSSCRLDSVAAYFTEDLEAFLYCLFLSLLWACLILTTLGPGKNTPCAVGTSRPY